MNLEHLNDKQREAATHMDGPLLILAGAGSGKTSTMTHRIAWLVEQGVAPWNILAVTFTNKAAGEMRERVEDLIGDTRGMWIMTFHAMCLRILRAYPEEIGYEKNFVIYDTSDQKTLVKNILKEKGISEKEFAPQYLLAAISHSKEKGMEPAEVKQQSSEGYRTNVVVGVYEAYQAALRKNNAMDFDDILLNCLRLFQKEPGVLMKYQDRFHYIMVDEYQDTNHIQYQLVTLLAENHHNICVVGDDDQCIYEWRGADIRNILDFEKDFPEAKVIKLEQNYRSVGNILAAAHSVIRNNRGRKSKKLWTTRDPGNKIVYQRLPHDGMEAGFIAKEIARMHDQGRPLTDFAILYRTNAQSRIFETVLSKYGIPCRVLSGMRYYDRKEVKDAMAYMRLVVNPRDDLSLMRIINEPKRGMGTKTVEKIAAFAQVRGESMLEALCAEEVQETLPGKAYDKVCDLVEILALCRRERANMTVLEVFETLIGRTGYLDALEQSNTIEAESRIENLMEFKTVITDYEKGAEDPTVEEFMENLTLAAEVDNYDEAHETVTLMTMHSAKGLEFPVVFMPGMEDGLFPGNKAFDSTDGMEEERRLCYVGMTRAKELLYLTSAEERTRYGRTEYTRESQFLREMDHSLLQGTDVYRQRSGTGGPGVSTGSYDGFAETPYRPFGAGGGAGSGAGGRVGGTVGGASGRYSGSRAASGNAGGRSKPIDSLKYARMATKQTAAGGDTDLVPGDKVRHSKFGTGMVVENNGKIVQVMFDEAGLKKMAVGVAPLKKL